MSIQVYHRTTIGGARAIIKHGFEDREWDFGLLDVDTGEVRTVTGVWLSEEPLERTEEIDGDAQLEVTLFLSEDELKPYDLEGLRWDARLWVAPAELINSNSSVRILEVDPTTSGWFEAQGDNS